MSFDSFFQDRHKPAKPVRPTIRRRLLGRGNRLRTLGSAVALVSLGLTLGQSAHAAPVTWDGTVADWYDTVSGHTHWSNNSFPGAGDDASNSTGASMTLGANGQGATVNSFSTNGAFRLFNGVTFSGSQANSASTLTLLNSIFTLDGGQINNFTVQSSGGGSVVVTGAGNNSLSNTVVTTNLDVATNANAFLRLFNTNTIGTSAAAGSLTLGTYNTNGGYGLRLNNGANLVIGGMGTFQGFGVVSEETSASTVTNNGLINASSNGNTLSLNQTFFNNNAGATAEATNGGILSLTNNIASSGMIKATGTNSVVGITGTFTGTGTAASGNLITASGGGQVQVNGASLQGTINTDPNTFLVINGSNNNSLSGTTVNGNLDLSTNVGAFLRLYGTDTINGMITLGTYNTNGGYGLRLNNGANLVIGGMGTFQGFGVVSEETSASTVTNNGLINANTSGDSLNFNETFFTNNAGATAEATNGGTLSLNNNIASSGAVSAIGANSVVGITGTFTGTGTAASGNLITASGGGQVQINGASLLGTINTAAATMSDPATALMINGSNSNSLSGTTVNGNLDLSTNVGAFLRLYGTDTVNGMITLGTYNTNGGYGLRLNNGATLLLNSGSSLTGFGVVSEETSASTLTNNGLVNANSFVNGGSNTLTMAQTTFNNNGTAEATGGGTLSLNNTTNNSAGATVAAIGKSNTGVGSVVGITGTFTGAGNNLITASGGGSVQIAGASLLGTINTDASTALLFNGSGGNNLSNTTVNGNLFVAPSVEEGDPGEFLRLYGTDTVNGTITLGTYNLNGGYGLRLNNGANLIIGASTGNGSSLVGSGNVSEETSASTLTNNNLVNANSNGLTLTMGQSTFTNSAGATAEATNGGILSLNNTTNNSGAVSAIGANSVVGITGTFTGTGSSATNLITASGGGSVQIAGASLLGTINTDASTALLFNGSGGNNLSNTTVNGNLFVAPSVEEGDPGEFLRLYGTDTVNGTITLGTYNLNGGYGLRLNNGANLIIGASTGNGSSLVGSGNVSEETSASTLTNNNLVNANSNGLTLTMGQSTFTNSAGATAEATNGGILSLNNTTNNSGAVSAIGANSVVGITGTFTGTGSSATNLITASGGGSVQIAGASLLGTINTDASTALLFNSSGGNNLSNTTVNGNLFVAPSVLEGDPGEFLRLYGTDTVNGTITLGTYSQNNGYGLRLNNGANLVIGSTGILQGSGNISEETSASTLTNNGTINANVTGGNVLTFTQSNFNNASTGTTQVANGATLNVTSTNAATSGAITVLPGGIANFTNNLTQTAGLTEVFGTLNTSTAVTGGTFGGSGTVNGNVTNTGGTVESVNGNPGPGSTGSLVINGNFSQSSGGTLGVFFRNDAHTLLTVTGQTTTGGTLSVFDQDPKAPAGFAAGTPFAFLDYSGTLMPDGSTVNGFAQYFTNEIPDSNTSGKIMGAGGFLYELTNVFNQNSNSGMLDLTVITAGSPVPEASTTVSLGLLLALGLGGMVVAAKRKKRA